MKMRTKDTMVGLLLATPFFVGFIAFFAAPFVISIVYTFTFGTGAGKFVGLKNYQEVISSKAFQLAAYNTIRFIAIGVPLIMSIAFILSLVLKRKFGGSSFFRSVFLFPLVLPVASTVMVFQVVFAETGIMNTIYLSLNLPVKDWLSSDSAFAILVFLYVWKNCGYNIVLLLSGLNAIPEDFYEAARMEGANFWHCFKSITMPIMMPTVFFVFVISIVNSFKSFREAFLLGGAMPRSKSIYMLQHFMNNNFSNLNYQRLSAAALLVFLIIFSLIFVLFRLRKKAGDVQL